MRKRVTLADIARYTGLSTATVSLALNGRPGSRIPQATANRVREAAQELGYIPNVAARTLRSGRSGVIGVLSDQVTVTRFASAMIRGLVEAADRRGHHIMIMETGHDLASIDDAVQTFAARQMDALVMGIMASRALTVPLHGWDVPHVVVNGAIDGWPSVLPDEYAAGRRAVEYLAARGHRNIAMIGHYPEKPSSTVSLNIWARMQGIDAAMQELGLEFVARHDGTVWEPDLGYVGTQAILDVATPTAMLAANDRVAFGIYQAAAERRLSLPEDLSVMSFDDEDLAELMRPQLTTMRLDYQGMGAKAADLVLDWLQKSADGTTVTPSLDPVRVPMPVIERDSVLRL